MHVWRRDFRLERLLENILQDIFQNMRNKCKLVFERMEMEISIYFGMILDSAWSTEKRSKIYEWSAAEVGTRGNGNGDSAWTGEVIMDTRKYQLQRHKTVLGHHEVGIELSAA